MPPALFATPAIGSPGAAICSAALRTLRTSAKSASTDVALPWGGSFVSFSGSRSLPGSRPTSKAIPRCASSLAARRPIPEVGPVMTQTSFCWVMVLDMVCSAVGVAAGLARQHAPDCLEGSLAPRLGFGWIPDERVRGGIGDSAGHSQHELNRQVSQGAPAAALNQRGHALLRFTYQAEALGADVIRDVKLRQCPAEGSASSPRTNSPANCAPSDAHVQFSSAPVDILVLCPPER